MKWSDLDIAIGWQSPGNYPNWKSWMIGYVDTEGQGDLTTKTIRIYMITFFGLYGTIRLMRPKGFAELREDQQ